MEEKFVLPLPRTPNHNGTVLYRCVSYKTLSQHYSIFSETIEIAMNKNEISSNPDAWCGEFGNSIK